MASWVKATEECVRMLYCPGSELPDDVILHCVCVCVVLWMFWANAWKPHPPSHSATPQCCAWVYGCKPSEAEQAECSGSGAMVCRKEGQQASAVISFHQSNSFQKAESMYRELNHGCGWKKNAPVLWHLLTQLQTQPREMCHTIRSVRKSGL